MAAAYRDPNDLREWSEVMTMITGRKYSIALSQDASEMARYIEKSQASVEAKIPTPEPQILPYNEKLFSEWRANMRGIAEQTRVAISTVPQGWWDVEYAVEQFNK